MMSVPYILDVLDTQLMESLITNVTADCFFFQVKLAAEHVVIGVAIIAVVNRDWFCQNGTGGRNIIAEIVCKLVES